MARHVTEMSITPDDRPFGTAYLPELRMGVDLDSLGYQEQEWLLSGTASVWRHDQGEALERVTSDLSFCTRVLVRRPATGAPSGLVQVEPLHPDLDSALVWNAIHPWLIRERHTWMGVTVFPAVAAQLTDLIDPVRYADIAIPVEGLQYDILAEAVQAMLAEEFGSLGVDRVILAGMSATGSFCRVVLQDGFHRSWNRPDGRRLIDGYVMGISSGGAGAAGYPPLSASDSATPLDSPRRIVDPQDAVAFEVLSETEAETHELVTRPDADADSGTGAYRLYEIAGTAHIEAHPGVLTNLQQFERRGGLRPAFAVNEERSDARFDLYLRGALEAMDRRLVVGTAPPRMERFQHHPGTETLVRDADGNVVGGVRSPWLTVPTGVYSPHSTASRESEPPPEWMPFSRPEMLARLVGSMKTFDLGELRSRYGSRAAYLDHFAAAVEEQVAGGLLLEADAGELLREAPQRWPG